MRAELFRGIGPIQILAIFFHVGILVIVQQLLNRLAKMLRVDPLSLVNDRSTRTAVALGTWSTLANSKLCRRQECFSKDIGIMRCG
jgi:hypothetical protein